MGLDRPEIPPLPGIIVPPPVADPLVSLPTSITGTPGSTVTVPVNIDDANLLEVVDLRIGYDPAVVDVLAVRPGTVTRGATLVTNPTDPTTATGTLAIGLALGTPYGPGGGSLLEVDYRIKPTAPGGPVLIDLRQVSLNEGALVVTPAPVAGPDATDGVITVVAASENLARSEETVDSTAAPGAPAGTPLDAALDVGLGQPVRDVSPRQLIDWLGRFTSSGDSRPGAAASTIFRSARPWVRRFLLDLAVPEEAAGPNRDIRVVLPVSAELEPIA